MNSEDVQRMRNIAIVMANTARLNARIEAMKAANAEKERHNLEQVYSEAEFQSVIDEEGMGWNSVMGQLSQ